MSIAFVVIDGGVEYTTPFHPRDEMMWYIPHHSIREKAGALTATECYDTWELHSSLPCLT